MDNSISKETWKIYRSWYQCNVTRNKVGRWDYKKYFFKMQQIENFIMWVLFNVNNSLTNFNFRIQSRGLIIFPL